MAHLPTYSEVERIVAVTGANRIAVDNFLDGLDVSMPKWFHMKNLKEDAAEFNWRASTVRAIELGIRIAYEK